jgi:aspartyl/asparaginyl-tRNA synthetase
MKKEVKVKDIDNYVGREVNIRGRIDGIRSFSKNLHFLYLRDNTGCVQMVSNDDSLKDLKRESIVNIHGCVRPNPKYPEKMEIDLKSIKILSSPYELPIRKVDDSPPKNKELQMLERSYEFRNPKKNALLRLRSASTKYIRDYLDKEGFMEVLSPIIVNESVEGKTKTFKVDFYDKKAYLAINHIMHQQMLLSGDFERVYEATPIFRAANTDNISLSEFQSIDFSSAYENLDDVIKITNNTLNNVVNNLNKNHTSELEKCGIQLPESFKANEMTYDEFIEKVNERNVPLEWGSFHQTPKKAAKAFEKKEFLWIKYMPEETKPFYIKEKCLTDEKIRACCAEIFHPNSTASITAHETISDYENLVQKMKRRNLNMDAYKYYLESVKYGMPPNSQVSIGLERFLMSLFDLNDIRDVSYFHRDKTTLNP